MAMSSVFPLPTDDKRDEIPARAPASGPAAAVATAAPSLTVPPAAPARAPVPSEAPVAPFAKATAPVAPVVAKAPQSLPPEQTFEIDDDAEGIRSYLADGEVIDGSLRLKNGIRIAGTVTGRVHCEKGSVIVERTGTVSGGVEASGKIIVDGQVGDEKRVASSDDSEPAVRTPGLLAVMGTGRVYGCYQYGRIATYDDATIEGMGKKIR